MMINDSKMGFNVPVTTILELKKLNRPVSDTSVFWEMNEAVKIVDCSWYY